MSVIVCGGRNFTDSALLYRTMDARHAAAAITVVIEGGQRTYRDGQPVGGADLLAWNWATSRGIPVTTVSADWSDLSHPNARIRTGAGGRRYDADAGPRRNAAIWRWDLIRSSPSPAAVRAPPTWSARRARQETEQIEVIP